MGRSVRRATSTSNSDRGSRSVRALGRLAIARVPSARIHPVQSIPGLAALRTARQRLADSTTALCAAAEAAAPAPPSPENFRRRPARTTVVLRGPVRHVDQSALDASSVDPDHDAVVALDLLGPARESTAHAVEVAGDVGDALVDAEPERAGPALRRRSRARGRAARRAPSSRGPREPIGSPERSGPPARIPTGPSARDSRNVPTARRRDDQDRQDGEAAEPGRSSGSFFHADLRRLSSAATRHNRSWRVARCRSSS